MSISAEIENIFKRMYDDESVHDMTMKRHPLLTKMRKVGRFGGVTFHYATRYGNPQGISGTFSNAQTNATLTRDVQWSMGRAPKYGIVNLKGEDILAAQVGKDSSWMVDHVMDQTDAVISEMGCALAWELPRDGTAMRGRIASISGDELTLTVLDDARHFRVGMKVQADDSATGASPRAGIGEVESIDEEAGKVTLVSAAAITGLAANDYLFRDGDIGTAMDGLASHFPLTAPAPAALFRGVERAKDVRRLSGSRLDAAATNMYPEEAAARVAVKCTLGGGLDGELSVWMNPIHVEGIILRQGAKVDYAAGGTVEIGFTGVRISSVAGIMKVYADHNFPVDRGYVLSDSNYIKHLGGLPHVVEDDGKRTLRNPSTDSIQSRIRSFANSVAPRPGDNGVFSINATSL